MKKILIPIDGSENSRLALLEGKKLGEVFKSEVLILYVERIDQFRGPYADVYVPIPNEEVEEAGKKVIVDGLEVFKDYQGVVETMIEFGDPAETIIEVADKKNMDLVVMGSRGLSGIQRFLLGSVSNKVLNHSHTSVLIIR